MEIYNASPWRNKWLSPRVTTMVGTLLLLLMVLIGFSSVFTMHKAHAGNVSVCSSMTIVQDGKKNYSGTLEDKLRSAGVENISYVDAHGKSNQDVLDSIPHDECVIVDYKVDKDVEGFIRNLNIEEDKKVFFALPMVSHKDAHYDDNLKYSSEVYTFKPNNENFVVVDFNMIKDDDTMYSSKSDSLSEKGNNSRVSTLVQNVITSEDQSQVYLNDIMDNSNGNADGNTVVASNVQGVDPNGVGVSPESPPIIGGENGLTGDQYTRSPRAVMDAIKGTDDLYSASRFIAAKRWSGIILPTQPQSGFALTSIMSVVTSWTGSKMFTLISGMGQAGVTLTIAAFGSGLLSFMLKISDGIFAWLTSNQMNDGGTSNIGGGPMGALFGAVVMVTIITSLIRVFSPNSSGAGSMNQKIAEVGLSVFKVVAALGVLTLMSIQSQKNGTMNKEQISSELTDSITTSKQASRSISSPQSWTPGSLGWAMSAIYWTVNQVVSSVVEVTSIMVTGPIDGMNNVTNLVQRKGDYNFACDRYVDSMHVLFTQTRAYADNKSTGDLIMALDYLTLPTYSQAFSSIYGDFTSSGQNSWCYDVEINSGVPAQEFAIIARGAGLYKEAIGSGNLMTDNNTEYAVGNHYTNANSNLSGGGLPVFDGYLVSADGRWIADNPEDAEMRLNQFYGSGGSGTAKNIMSYYFAACVWAPTADHAALSEEWRGVRAMGDTGGVNGDAVDEKNNKKELMEILPADQALDGKVIGSAANMINYTQSTIVPQLRKPEYTVLLNDYDCVDPLMFPIGYDDQENVYGPNSTKDNLRVERWNYTPKQGQTLADEIGTTIANVFTNMLKGKGLKAEDEDKPNDAAKDTKNPLNKFGANIYSLDGHAVSDSPAARYWLSRSGGNVEGNMKLIWGAFLMTVGTALVMLISIALGFIVNFVFSLMFLVLPMMLVLSIMIYALKGGRN